MRCAAFHIATIVALASSAVHAQDMPLSQVLIDGEGWELVADGFQFTEGPAADPEGRLYFTDLRANRIYRLDEAGRPEVFVEASQKTNGLMFGPDGLLYGCQNGLRRIVSFDSSGTATVVADDVDCNDLVVTGDGGIYFTDPPNGRVWYVAPDREKRVAAEGMARPNGIILWRDQATLVVADTAGDVLWTFRVESDGNLAFRQPYYTLRLPPGEEARSGADGMTIDSDGRIYVTTAVGLQMFDTTGRMGGVILKPQDAWLANAAFAGPNLETLYVTSSDKLYRRKTKVQGVRYTPLP